MNWALRIPRFFFAFAASACLFVMPAAAPAAGPPSPAESVLIIYSSATAYGISLKDTWVNALSSVVPAPAITLVPCAAGDIGIYGPLAGKNLSDYCQVYDLRFREDRNNLPYTGANQNDVITFTGANNDTLLYTNYLNANGHLFLQGEHHDYYIRDLNLFAFINSVANTPISSAQIYADVNSMNPGSIGGFSSFMGFNTNWNNIAAGCINAGWPGGLEPGYAGSGHAIGADFACSLYCGGGAQANTAYAWMSSDLKTNGKLVVNFETNGFVDPYTGPCGGASVAVQWIQNVYQLLSGCYRYSLTKAFTPANLCVGDPGAFTLCYSNTGSTTLNNVPIWDTLPPCLTYNGNSTDIVGAPSINGQVYSWTIPSIAPAASACITVNFTVNSFTACP